MACPQVRSNGLIVFVPKYGIEGPVYLDDGVVATTAAAAEVAASAAAETGGAAAAAAAAAGPSTAGGSGSGRRRGGAAAESNFVYDEEKQVGGVEVGALTARVGRSMCVTLPPVCDCEDADCAQQGRQRPLHRV